jgi:hypothetical protein
MNINLKDYLINFENIWNEKCRGYDNLPNILPATRRIIVIGDVHGDFNKTKELLILGKVINKKGKWIGGDTIVVQLGDQIDSCRPDGIMPCTNPNATLDDKAEDIKILRYFTELHKLAQKEGGAVYSLIGNHEMMNVDGNFKYVSYQNLMSTGGEQARAELFKPGNKMANFLACTRSMVLIIGSNIFVHAGLLPEIVNKYKIQDINKLLSLFLLDELKIPEYFRELFMSSHNSPIWTRIFGNINQPVSECERLMKPLNKVYQVGKIFVGHTPQMDGITSTCNERIWLTDYGASKAFDKFNKSPTTGQNTTMTSSTTSSTTSPTTGQNTTMTSSTTSSTTSPTTGQNTTMTSSTTSSTTSPTTSPTTGQNTTMTSKNKTQLLEIINDNKVRVVIKK